MGLIKFVESILAHFVGYVGKGVMYIEFLAAACIACVAERKHFSMEVLENSLNFAFEWVDDFVLVFINGYLVFHDAILSSVG